MTVAILTCPDCGDSMEHFPRDRVYRCRKYPACKGAHGAHPDGEPMGVPANAATRRLRMDVHRALGRIWPYNDRFRRMCCYTWLQEVSVGHVSCMDADECHRVLALLTRPDGGRTMTLATALALAQYYYGGQGHAEYDPFAESYSVGILLTTAVDPVGLQKAPRRFIVSGTGSSWEGAFTNAGRTDIAAQVSRLHSLAGKR